MDGIERIAAERKRQIESTYTFVCEDYGALARAAVCYALPDEFRGQSIKYSNFDEPESLREYIWPWYETDWNPNPENRIEELSKAGALIAAEIDRLLMEKASNE